jgi:hypothetical protein
MQKFFVPLLAFLILARVAARSVKMLLGRKCSIVSFETPSTGKASQKLQWLWLCSRNVGSMCSRAVLPSALYQLKAAFEFVLRDSAHCEFHFALYVTHIAGSAVRLNFLIGSPKP